MRGMHGSRLPSWAIGLFMVVVLAIGSVLAYTKELPWSDPYQVTATFASGQNLRSSNPVRIAGVDVGEVTEVELIDEAEATELASTEPGAAGDGSGTAVKVTMALSEEALPLHEDALFKVRPRLFLEGNYFIDLQPGSPSAPEVSDGHAFPVNRTAYAVQLDQVLTTLQADVRTDLQTLLREFGSALIVHGGAQGLNDLNRSGPLYRFSSQAAEAFRGTEPGDLPGMISGLEKVLGGLSKSESDLRDLITNFRVFTGSFAAEDEALGRAVEQLPDTLAAADPFFTNLNASLPAVRAFAREALPGVRTSPAALRAGRPFLEQLRLLMSPPELQGLVADLRPTVPELHTLGRGNLKLLTQSRALSSCFNEVVIPWSKDQVQPVGDYPHGPGEAKVFEQGPYGITGTAVESRSGDSNGQSLRVLGGSGANIVRSNIGGLGDVVALTPFELLGAMPRLNDSAKTPFEPDVACETQEPPNLEGGLGAPPADQQPIPLGMQGIDALEGPDADRFRERVELVNGLQGVAGLLDSGDRSEARGAEREIERGQRFFDMLGLTDIDLESALGVSGR